MQIPRSCAVWKMGAAQWLYMPSIQQNRHPARLFSCMAGKDLFFDQGRIKNSPAFNSSNRQDLRVQIKLLNDPVQDQCYTHLSSTALAKRFCYMPVSTCILIPSRWLPPMASSVCCYWPVGEQFLTPLGNPVFTISCSSSTFFSSAISSTKPSTTSIPHLHHHAECTFYGTITCALSSIICGSSKMNLILPLLINSSSSVQKPRIPFFLSLPFYQLFLDAQFQFRFN